jgi:hypothetical protein
LQSLSYAIVLPNWPAASTHNASSPTALPASPIASAASTAIALADTNHLGDSEDSTVIADIAPLACATNYYAEKLKLKGESHDAMAEAQPTSPSNTPSGSGNRKRNRDAVSANDGEFVDISRSPNKGPMVLTERQQEAWDTQHSQLKSFDGFSNRDLSMSQSMAIKDMEDSLLETPPAKRHRGSIDVIGNSNSNSSMLFALLSAFVVRLSSCYCATLCCC